ncbi:MAG: hypothetical protein AAF531_00785 [Actinomycetota bacterium]
MVHAAAGDAALWFSRSAYSRLMDRAGPHRRGALAMPILAAALLLMAVSNVAAGATAPIHWVPHVVLVIGLGWTLVAILGTGRLVDGDGAPHAGLVVVGVGLLWWAVVAIGGSAPLCCWPTVTATGGGAVMLGVSVVVDAERRSPRPALLGGRVLLSLGALLLGFGVLLGVLGRLPAASPTTIVHTAGLSVLGSSFVVLALAEARLAARLAGYGMDRSGSGRR